MKKHTLSAVIAVALLLGLTVPAVAQSSEPARIPIVVLGRGTANALSWRPDGEVLAVGSATGVWLLDEALHITGHQTPLDYITDLAWSPTGDRIALAGHSGETCHVQIWSADFASALADLTFCGERILWSPDGTHLAAFDGFDGHVVLIDALSGEEIAMLPGQSGVWAIDGATLITEKGITFFDNSDLGLHVWDSTTGAQLSFVPPPDNTALSYPVLRRATGPTTVEVLCSTQDQERWLIRFCDLDIITGESTVTTTLIRVNGDLLESNTGLIPNSNRTLFISRWDPGSTEFSNLYLLDPVSGRFEYLGYGQTAAWQPGTSAIGVIVGNGLIRRIDAVTGELLAEEMLFTTPISGIAWRPDNPEIASTEAGKKRSVRVWDATQSNTEPDQLWQADLPGSIAYTPDGSTLVTYGNLRRAAERIPQTIWDANSGDSTQELFPYEGLGCGGSPPLAWNREFTEYVMMTRSDRFWTPVRPELQIETAGPCIRLLSWSPDEMMIAVSNQDLNGEFFSVETWELATGDRINFIQIDMQASASQLVWSPDSTMLAVVSARGAGGGVDRAVSAFRIIPGNYLVPFSMPDFQIRDWVDYHPMNSTVPIQIAWHPNSTLLAAALRGEIALYDVNSGEKLLAIPIRDVTGLAWASDGHALAAGSTDGLIRVWDLSDLARDQSSADGAD